MAPECSSYCHEITHSTLSQAESQIKEFHFMTSSGRKIEPLPKTMDKPK
jgi:hypothetical protein